MGEGGGARIHRPFRHFPQIQTLRLLALHGQNYIKVPLSLQFRDGFGGTETLLYWVTGHTFRAKHDYK